MSTDMSLEGRSVPSTLPEPVRRSRAGRGQSWLLIAVLAIGSFCVSGSAGHSQELGNYLVSLGYRTTGWAVPSASAHGWVPAYGAFDPSVNHPDLPDCFSAATRTACLVAFDARYGGGSKHPSQGGGNLVGERFSDETLAAFFTIKGLNPKVPTRIDRSDAEYVLTAWDGLISPTVGGGVGSGTCTCACTSPKVCMDPKTCPTCPICPTCPALVAVPADILATAKGAPGWISSSRKAQRARLQALANWLAKVESVKVKP